MKKKAFTMIEIILVVLILSIIFFSLRNVFQVKNKDLLYGQTCVEKLYGNIDTFVNSAIRSKSLLITGTTFAHPDTYIIYIDKESNSILLSYSENGAQHLYQQLDLSGNSLISENCTTASYNIILSGANLEVTINKGLAQDQNLQSFMLSGSGGFTGSMDIMQCQNSSCNQIAQLLIDTRTQAIQKKLCLTLSGSVCEEWDK